MTLNKKFLRGLIFTVSSFVVLIAPTIILFLINREQWVQEGDSVRISIGVLFGLLYAILVMRGALKEISVKTATLLSMFTFLAIVWFLDSILQDLFWIILSVIIGYIFYMVMSTIGDRHMNEYKAYKDEKVRMKARQQQEEEEEILGV